MYARCVKVQEADLEDSPGDDALPVCALAALHGVRLPSARLPIAKQAHLQQQALLLRDNSVMTSQTNILRLFSAYRLGSQLEQKDWTMLRMSLRHIPFNR